MMIAINMSYKIIRYKLYHKYNHFSLWLNSLILTILLNILNISIFGHLSIISNYAIYSYKSINRYLLNPYKIPQKRPKKGSSIPHTCAHPVRRGWPDLHGSGARGSVLWGYPKSGLRECWYWKKDVFIPQKRHFHGFIDILAILLKIDNYSILSIFGHFSCLLRL